MKKAHWQKMLPFITAFVEDEVIHYEDEGELKEPDFHGDPEDYEIIPFQLPAPPEGKVWHNSDGWKRADLPPGYRPMWLGEMPQERDEVKQSGEWREQNTRELQTSANKFASPQRTKRPLVAEPATAQAHNPKNLTPEQVGEGWRLRAVGERITNDDEFHDSEGWNKPLFPGTLVNPSGTSYRTRAGASLDEVKTQINEVKKLLATLEAKLHV